MKKIDLNVFCESAYIDNSSSRDILVEIRNADPDDIIEQLIEKDMLFENLGDELIMNYVQNNLGWQELLDFVSPTKEELEEYIANTY